MRRVAVALSVLVASWTAGCTTELGEVNGTLAGVAYYGGPLRDASVRIRQILPDGSIGKDPVALTTTDSDGRWRAAVDIYSGAFEVEVVGGVAAEVASGTDIVLEADARLPSNSLIERFQRFPGIAGRAQKRVIIKHELE
jgi:hypothetical protein